MPQTMSQQLMFAQAFSAILEKLIEQFFRYNLHGTRALKPLSEKTLTVKLDELSFPLSFTVNNEKIHVSTSEAHYDCCLVTSVSTLIELQKEQQLTDLIRNDKLDIQGDLKVAQRFADIAQSLDIDWQSELAKRVGDIPAYKLGQLGRKIVTKLSFARQQIEADASEWLVHENRLIVTSGELSSFSREVDVIEQQLPKLSQRIENLINRFNKSS